LQEKTKTAAEQKPEPVVIKKYANRRLYNTETSTYVTLDDLAEMVRSERDFIVYDAKTGEDLTHSVLTQIIVDQEGRGSGLLPVPFLRQLIRFYGDSMGAFVPSYLQLSLETLTKEQERYRKQFAHLFSGKAFGTNPFGAAALEAMQEQARQNIAMFEKALGVFAPFHGGSDTSGHKPSASSPTSSPAGQPAELNELKAQLSAMQVKIDKLAKNNRE
jgi:polyhydroxyalkanoate synthesis repressor PhaR